MKREIHIIVLSSFMTIVFLVAFAPLMGSCQKTEKTIHPVENVTIGIGSGGLALPFIIARENNFFREEGLDVTLRFYSSGKIAMASMFAGETDIATVADSPIVLNSFLRNDFSVIATFANSYEDCKVIGRKDKGIGTPEDLKGKAIGTVFGSSLHFFAELYLSEHGIEPSMTRIVNFQTMEIVDALAQGKVDAIVIHEPFASMTLTKMPDKAIKLPKSNLYKQTFNLVLPKRYSDDHAESMIKFLKAVDRAITFLMQNWDESVSIMTKSLKPGEDSLVSVQEDLVYGLSLEHSLLTILEDEARWAMKNKLSNNDKMPNYLDYFYVDAMKVVKPGAVSIIK